MVPVFVICVCKTKIQNLGQGVTPAPVQLQGHIVESTDCFTYLGSDIHSSERSTPEILRSIGLASNIFDRLANVWKRTGLSLQTKIRLYNALVISILLYGSETWTLLKADERRLEAFHHKLPTTDLRTLHGLNDNDACRIAHDRESWMALRPIAGQAFQ